MPHVKGNKFKPAVSKDEAPRNGKVAKSEEPQQPEPNAALQEQAVQPPSKKKAKRSTPKPPLPLPPTVVAALPKPGKATAAVAATNWTALKAVLDSQPKKRKREAPHAATRAPKTAKSAAQNRDNAASSGRGLTPDQSKAKVTELLALDCEMVGIGPKGEKSSLARVCIVNGAGDLLMDVYVRQTEPVTDYRTDISGVRPRDLLGAWAHDTVKGWVHKLVANKVVVGHALHNDLQALKLSIPPGLLRDTARYPPLMKKKPNSEALRAQSLKVIANQELGLAIQDGEHSPVDDARAALYIYLKHRKDWERWIKQGGRTQDAKKVLSWEELAQRDSMADL